MLEGKKSLIEFMNETGLTMHTPEWDNRKLTDSILSRFPIKMARSLKDNYQDIEKTKGNVQANIYLREIYEDAFEILPGLSIDAYDFEIHSYAKRKARSCSEFRLREKMEVTCEKIGISPPSSKLSDESAIARMTCPDWWSKKLRRAVGQRLERISIKIGMVQKRKAKYVSDETLKQYVLRQARTEKFLESFDVINDIGQTYQLSELHELSIANPKLRRNELMCRLSGFETLAKDMNYVCDFVTITCPSRMHYGNGNQHYDETTPKEAQQYLANLWALIRTALSNRGIKIFGFRIVEPHCDGTPHWHMLIYSSPKNSDVIQSIIRKYSMKDSPDELGAAEYRFKSERIDPSKGSATAYIAKYISKNIDGYGMESEDIDNAIRVRAWASLWGIRQFQQIGSIPVTVWRELRRIRNTLSGKLEEARKAADAGDWAGYVMSQGDPVCTRKDLRVATLKVWNDSLNRYGEVIGNKIIGVTDGVIDAVSRFYEWRKIRRPSIASPLEYCQ